MFQIINCNKTIDDRQFVKDLMRTELRFSYLEQNIKNKIIVILDRGFSSAVTHVLTISNI